MRQINDPIQPGAEQILLTGLVVREEAASG
jgi:hypothetical protein